MGYEADGIALYCQYTPDEEVYGEWVDAATVDGCLLEPLRAAGLLSNATHYRVNFDGPQPIGSPGQLITLAAQWRDETVALYAGDVDEPDWLFHFALDRSVLRLTLGIGAGFHVDDIRQQADQLVRRWCELLAGRRCKLSFARLEPSNAAYPRPRPPRTGTFWPLGGIDYGFGRSWHTDGHWDVAAGVFAAVERAELPTGATRTTDGDLLRIAFAADLTDVTDAPAVAAARAAGERWLTPLIPTRVEPGWNELGDRLVVPPQDPPDRVELPPFTYYDAANQTAYKALVMDPDSQVIDEDMWAQLVAIMRAGRPHDGKPIRSVRLVFPARENAVFIHDRAIADGFEMVTYPQGSVFWEVGPA
jgi:hypothetical protein